MKAITTAERAEVVDLRSFALPVPGSDGWKCSVMHIGPEAARRMLERNEGNRPIRRHMFARYAATMAAGNWRTSPEPIVIGKSGRLLNGQHRLSAVITSGAEVPFMVVSGVDDAAFEVIDRGGPRSLADALQKNKRLIEVAALLARLWVQRPTDNQIKEMAEVIEEPHQRLITACPSTTKVFSSAPMRLAATVRLLAGYDPEYIVTLYRELVLGRVAGLPPVAQGFVGAVLAGRVVMRSSGGGGQYEMIARAWDLYDPAKANNARIMVRDTSRALEEIRRILAAGNGGED